MDKDTAFTPSEADEAAREYVCAVCHHDLEIVEVSGEYLRLVVCPIHGDITEVGRITRSTVSMEAERSHADRISFIGNLSDLYPELADQGMPRESAVRIQHTHVCAMCGNLLVVTPNEDFSTYFIDCRHHPGAGTCRREKFVYNFQAMRAWEKNHKQKQGA